MRTPRRTLPLPLAAIGLAAAVGCSDTVSPAPDPLPPWTAVAAGGLHTCAMADDGRVFCWGANDNAQLGLDARTTSSLRPHAVRDERRFASMGAGVFHNCALKSDGEPYCWGRNIAGQLGNPNAPPLSDRPVPVAGGHAFTSMHVGGYHTCGLDAHGSARCWGASSFGQVGYGGRDVQRSPVTVRRGITFATMGAGDRHTCGVAASGELYCWGRGDVSQLGTENPPNTCGGEPCALEPELVTDAPVFTLVTGGAGHTCALTAEGEAFCWGWARFGQLGDGTSGDDVQRAAPGPVAGDYRFSTLSAGGGTTCGLVTGTGEVVCWGYNEEGQLGRGHTDTGASPAPVAGGLRATAVSVGEWHACARTADSEIWCWGRNHRGQIGDATTTDRHQPVRAAGG